jgi:catechol 2,3-dioxygenase-like lactoylglutathione lyase family enzyme
VARIRYLAALTNEPQRLADFYVGYFGMREFARSDDGDISLTDGYFNLTFLRLRRKLRATEPRFGVGLNHIGLEVDSIERVLERYRKFNPEGIVAPEPGGPHYGEMRIYDPEFMPISLSEKSFGVLTSEATMPRLLHVAMNTFNPPAVMEFYRDVFGLRLLEETNKEFASTGLPNKFMGDGAVNLAIHSFYRGYNVGHQGSYGVNHFGFMVDDWKTLTDEIGKKFVAAPRPPNRPYEDSRVEDPDGNMVDLGETKGWELDNGLRVFPPSRSAETAPA